MSAAISICPTRSLSRVSPSLTLPRFAGEGIAAPMSAAARLFEVRS